MKTWSAYSSTGYVLGRYWAGGTGAYPAKRLHFGSMKALMDAANKGLEDGSLDSGMGFNGLIGAILEITQTKYATEGHEVFHRDIKTIEIIGEELTYHDKEFLRDMLGLDPANS